MPSTIASVLISRRTLRASRLRQVRRSTSARRLLDRGVLQAAPSWRGSGRGRGRAARRRSRRRRGRAPGRCTTPRPGRGVTITTVWPNSSTLRRRKPSTSALLVESRLPVGSSAKTIDGWLTSARAHATRCCWPPDISLGRWPRRGRRPTASTTWSNHARSGLRPARLSGSRMFSSALRVGTRLKDWKTKPTRSRRRVVRSLSLSLPSEVPSTTASPEVGVSSAARQCMRVDLPEPEGPMMAVNSPCIRSTVTPSRARTSASPLP